MMCVTFCYLQVSSFLFPASKASGVPVSMQHFQGEQTSKHKGKASLHYVKFHFFKHTFTGKKHLIFIFTAFAILTHISLTFYKKGRFSLFNGFQGTCILHSTYLRLTYSKYYVSKQFLLDMHVMGLVFYILVQPFSIANHIV